MSEKETILHELYEAVLAGATEKAVKTAQTCIEEGIPPLQAIEEGMTLGIKEVGERFSRGEAYLPEMMMSAETMQAALAILTPYLKKGENKQGGKVLIGTVKGDVHDIGKNIAASLLAVNGFDIIDIGRDNACDNFIDEAERSEADIIGMSALLTTSLPMMNEVMSIMEEEGVREDYKVIIGGGPTSQEYCDEIGADGYATNAHDGVTVCKRLMNID